MATATITKTREPKAKKTISLADRIWKGDRVRVRAMRPGGHREFVIDSKECLTIRFFGCVAREDGKVHRKPYEMMSRSEVEGWAEDLELVEVIKEDCRAVRRV